MARWQGAWRGLDWESACDFRFSPRIQPTQKIDESTALSEVYADDQNSSARAAMLADQSVARGCRLATIWDRIRIQSPILALVLSSGAFVNQAMNPVISQPISPQSAPNINPA